MKEIRYTYRQTPTAHTALELAKWVNEKMPQYTAGDKIAVARALLRGEGWEPPYYVVYQPEADGPCNFDVTEIEDEQTREFRLMSEEQARLRQLMLKGAEGDAAAAIEYCQAERDYKIRHGAFAG